MVKILITGGSGLVGSGIKSVINKMNEYKENEYIFVSSRDIDLSDYEGAYRYIYEKGPDMIVHLAACVGGLFKNLNNKVDMLEKNMEINMNVLKIAHKLNIQRVVSCLSTCIFPDRTDYPINESMLHNGPPHHSNDAYAYAKRMLEIQSRAYQENYNRDYICIIPTNIYGPNDNYNLEDAHVIPALIHRCFINKLNNEDFVVRGSGKPLRQFIYSEDLGKLILWVLFEYKERENIILSVDERDEISIGDIARKIAKEFDYEDKLIFDTNYSDGQYKKTADNTKLRSYLPEFEFTTIDNGIKLSIDWFKENYNRIRK